MASSVRFIVAVTAAALLTAGIVRLIPTRLQVATDIVGYPIYAAFNIDRIVDIYYLGILLFPAAAIGLYLGLTRLVGPRGGAAAAAHESVWPALDLEAGADGAPTWVRTAGLARLVAVGAVLGLEVAIILDAASPLLWLLLLGTAVVYAALVGVVALAMQRYAGERWTGRELVARCNATAAPLVLLGMAGVSAVTQVVVSADGSSHHYPWLPWWLAGAAALAAVAWVWWRASRTPSAHGIRSLERNTLVFLVAPVAIFLLVAAVPASLRIDAFHDGEHLAAATMTSHGFFPWRDLISIHGPFEDSLWPLLGLRVFGDSYWGYVTALTLLISPLFYVTLFLLAAWVVRRNWALVAIVGLIVVGGRLVPFVGARFMFWPLILLLLAAVLQRPFRWLSALLGACLAAQAVLIPEMAYALPACGLVLTLSDLYRRAPGARVAATFQRTLWCLAGGGTVAAALVVVLLIQRALPDFLFYYVVFAPGHALAGGLPLGVHQWHPFFAFLALGPVVALLIAWWYYAAKAIRRIPLDTADWIIGAAAIFALIYYMKYLARADLGHVDESYNAALPLMGFLLFRAVTFLDRAVARARWSVRLPQLTARPVSVALLAVALIATGTNAVAGPPLPARLTASVAQYRPTVAAEPAISRLGFGATGVDAATYQDLTRVLHSYLRPGDWVFDFSNEPALYYYLLGFQPHTRYYHVSMAIPEVAQKDLIAQLKRDPPKLVVFSNDRLGLPSWDGIPNMVRHYDVAQYILDHYRPLLSTHTQIIYAQSSADLSAGPAAALPLAEPIVIDNLYFRSPACDWGYAPNFLSISPPAPIGQAAPLQLQLAGTTTGLTIAGWAADSQTGLPARQVVAVAGGRAVSTGVPTIDRPDVVDALGGPGFLKSGFLLASPGAGPLRIFGISAGGIASELTYGPGARQQAAGSGSTPLAQIQLPDGSVVPVREGAVTGVVDAMSFAYRAPISLPMGAAWSSYRWLEITARRSFQLDAWVLSDASPGDPGREIDFRTQAGSPTSLRVYVGNCAQWHGYAGETLYLNHGANQEIASIRLLP